MPPRPLALAALSVFALGCVGGIPHVAPVPPGVHAPFEGYASARYRDDSMWLCRPDLARGPCHGDMTATEIRPDGTQAVVRHVPAAAPTVDCFYVYPTVDMRLVPGNHEDFHDNKRIEKTALAQAAQLDEACSVYAPLYRQVTIGTYFTATADGREKRLEVAASDVVDAFRHYMGQFNHGRKVVLVGHSQGAEMVVRLLKQVFDHDPAMRERLLVAMPLGGHVEVPVGKTTGGTFDTIPVCTAVDELGCVVAYQSYAESSNPTPSFGQPKAGFETVCVNPAAPEGGPTEHRFSRAYFPGEGPFRKMTHNPFVLMRDFYAGRCVNGLGGFRFLGVSVDRAPGDVRKNPLDFDSFFLTTQMGLHILDMQFAQGDLIDLIASKAAAARRRDATEGAPLAPREHGPHSAAVP